MALIPPDPTASRTMTPRPILLLLLVAGCSGTAAPKPKPPLSVAVEQAALADYAPRLTVLGTVTPLQSVAVRTRVDGQVTSVLFREGETVRAGQPLFRLDDRAMRATIAQNRASMASAAATRVQAAADLKRSQALIDSGFVSKATIELKQAAADTAAANIGGAAAAISAGETQLSYLTVRAPVAGRTGEINYKTGATVRTADALPLVTVNQLSPILVRFAVPPGQIQPLRSALAAGNVTVTARVHDSTTPIATGRLVFLDNNVDASTGSLAAKAEFTNVGDALWPGALVDIDVPLGGTARRIAVDEAAIQNGPDFTFVWTVADTGTVRLTRVVVAGRSGGKAYINSGLKPGVAVVTDALAKLREGDKVKVKVKGDGPAAGSQKEAGPA